MLAPRSLVRLSLLLLAAAALSACNTYSTTRVPEYGSARGYPFIFQKPYLVTITYTDGEKSLHFVTVPTLFAVDSERAALGTTKTEFENAPDGFASKTKTDLDQKVPENLDSITALLRQLGVTAAGAPVAPGAPELKFNPDLPLDKSIASIDLKPI